MYLFVHVWLYVTGEWCVYDWLHGLASCSCLMNMRSFQVSGPRSALHPWWLCSSLSASSNMMSSPITSRNLLRGLSWGLFQPACMKNIRICNKRLCLQPFRENSGRAKTEQPCATHTWWSSQLLLKTHLNYIEYPWKKTLHLINNDVTTQRTVLPLFLNNEQRPCMRQCVALVPFLIFIWFEHRT